jgi:outer membrane protein OmpA-like peptidoglycan-associated protein
MKHLVILASILAVGFLGACASMDEGMKKEEMKKAEAKPAAPKKKKLPPSGSPFTVYFKNNKVDLTEKSHGDLFDILQKVGLYKPKDVVISVYSDMTGSADYNKKLAEKRGKMLEGEFKEAGAKKISVTAVGAADPLVDKKGKVDANRRAVISFK